jgi:catechol 2,3-dioxygenase-like lactoylglutathione lyase family enzyme
MDATGVSHIAICVRDMENSLAFYRDILGMKVTKDEVQDTTQGGLPSVYKHPRKTRRTVHAAYGEGNSAPSLVLTSHPGDQTDGDPIKLDQIGISHLSFSVRNINGLREELVSKGVQLAAPMEAFNSPQTPGGGTFFVYDPDGILLQFDNVR